ncbi:hypothetical protein ABBQ38_001557 [Trebouxia sp. C0009 RCD-2024]
MEEGSTLCPGQGRCQRGFLMWLLLTWRTGQQLGPLDQMGLPTHRYPTAAAHPEKQSQRPLGQVPGLPCY